MAEDGDRPRPAGPHLIGEKLDALSLHEFDERIALLRAEIARLEQARRDKQAAMDQAGSIFKL